MSPWIPVVVTVVGAGGPLMWLLSRLDRHNTSQHAENKQVLERIEGKVDKVAERLDGHISWHLGDSSPKPRRKKDVV